MSEQTSEVGSGHSKAVRRLAVAVVALAASIVPPMVADADPLPIPPHNSGFGASTGVITYNAPMPPAGALCKSTLTSQVEWSSQAFVLNTVVSGFAGPVTIIGSATTGAGCESYSLGGGSMTLGLQGFNETTESKLDCRDGFDTRSSSLRGTYTRVGSDMTVVLSGKCLVNLFATGVVTFVARVQVVPSNASSGGGITAPVTSAKTAGAFVLAPA